VYPWCDRPEERLSTLVTSSVNFFVDQGKPECVRALARRACEVFAQSSDEATKFRARHNHGLVEAVIALRDSPAASAALLSPPLTRPVLAALREVVEGSRACISHMSEREQPALIIRHRRVCSLLALAQGQEEYSCKMAQTLLALRHRYLSRCQAGQDASLELARCALEAATQLAKTTSLSEEVLRYFPPEVGKLYAAAERGLSDGLGRCSYPAFLALRGMVRTAPADTSPADSFWAGLKQRLAAIPPNLSE